MEQPKGFDPEDIDNLDFVMEMTIAEFEQEFEASRYFLQMKLHERRAIIGNFLNEQTPNTVRLFHENQQLLKKAFERYMVALLSAGGNMVSREGDLTVVFTMADLAQVRFNLETHKRESALDEIELEEKLRDILASPYQDSLDKANAYFHEKVLGVGWKFYNGGMSGS